MVINSVSTNNDPISYMQNRQDFPHGKPSKAEKDRVNAVAKKAGVKITPGEKPSDADVQKLKKAGLDIKA
ncbi:MAG: hypothetical protein H6Q74_1647 [Firmicutes bacterium]|nr:hypothetical protein [Bacillota bacterium]